MKFLITFLVLLFIIDPILNTDCGNIKPTKASDCVLSARDKKYFDWCCYDVNMFSKKASCTAYSQSTYEAMKEVYKFDDEFKCNYSTSLYFKFTFLLLMLILF